MKIVVLGIGGTGHYLAQLFLQEGHDLVLIDKDEKRVRLSQEQLDAQIVHGDGANALVMEPLVDEDTDLFVAVTNCDEANIIASLIASKYGARRIITRVCDPTNLIHPLLTDDPKVSVVNSEITVAKDLARLVGNPSADEIEFFADGKAELIKLHVSPEAEVIFKKLKEVKIPDSWLFIARIHKGDFSIVSGDTIFQPGDQALVLGSPKNSDEIEELLGLHPIKVRRVVLVGFNDISCKLAMALVRRNIQVRLIEDDPDQAARASAELDDVLVIHGEITSEETLEQAGIDMTDCLLALTDDHENNVLVSLLAKEKKVTRVVALAQNPQYKPIIEKIGIDSVVDPRSALVEEIIRYVHHKDMSGIIILEGGKGRLMEFVVNEKNRVANLPISKIKLPRQVLIGAIVRGNDLIIPRGDDKVKVGDHIMVFTTRTAIKDVNRLFAK